MIIISKVLGPFIKKAFLKFLKQNIWTIIGLVLLFIVGVTVNIMMLVFKKKVKTLTKKFTPFGNNPLKNVMSDNKKSCCPVMKKSK